MFQSLLNFHLRLKIPRKSVLKELYLVWMIGYCWKKKYSILKKNRFLKNKTNNPLQVYETFYDCRPCDFIGNQCNEVGLNEGILNIFLTTWKSSIEFSLQLTNGIVIELYHFIIIKKKLTWKIFQDLLLKISNNKNNILSVESEKNLYKKVKSLVNTKSTLITTKNLMVWKHLKRVIFCFQILLLL